MKNLKRISIMFITIIFLFTLSSCDIINNIIGGDKKDSEHTYSEEWVTSSSSHYHKCIDEGCSSVSDFGSHEASDWITTKEATTTETGEKQKRCTICGYIIETEVIPKTTHNYANPIYTWSEDNSKCTATAYCTDNGCNEKYEETVNSTITVKTQASCLVNRVDNYTATFSKDFLQAQTKEIEVLNSKLEHDYSTEWTKDSSNHYHVCSLCGNQKDKAVHTPTEWITTKEPTETECGSKYKKCSICDYVITTESIPVITHTYGTPTYEWSSDSLTCTASVSCTDSGCTKVLTETVTATVSLKLNPTCTSYQVNNHKATFVNKEFTEQNKDVTTTIIVDHQYSLVDKVNETLLDDGFEKHYRCSSCNKYFDENKTECTQASLVINKTAASYTQVKELVNEDKTNISVIGIVIGFSYDGTQSHNDRHGFIIKDIESNDIVLVNGMATEFPSYKDKNNSAISLNQIVLIKGNFYKNHKYSSTSSQYYESLVPNQVESLYDIQVLENTTIDLIKLNITEVKNNTELNQALNINPESQTYKLIKIVGSIDNPISFSLINSGKVSEKNMGLFMGEYDSNTVKYGEKNLAISPYALSTTYNIEVANLYDEFYNFNSDSLSSMSASTTIHAYGTMYIAISQLTTNNIITSVVFNYELEFSKANLCFAEYIDEFNGSTKTSTTYTFMGGKGINDITNYIPSLNTTDEWKDDFEIQDGVLVYVGNDYINVAENLGIETGEKQDLEVKALLNTAYAYLYQGKEIQYDMYTNRRNININPEAATDYTTVFLDCSSYVNSIYYNTFGKDILEGKSGGKTPSTSDFNYVSKQSYSTRYGVSYYYSGTKLYLNGGQIQLTDSETLTAIRNYLEPGDLINYRKTSGGGHVMMYVGDNTLIHCTGSSYAAKSSESNYPYNYQDPSAIYDAATSQEKNNGSVQLISLDEVLTSTGERYLFSNDIETFSVLRPLNRTYTNGDKVFVDITEQAKNRLSLPNVEIEKLSSPNINKSVYRGQNITYTITLRNNNNYSISYVDIIEYVPEGTTYVSATTNGTNNDGTISWIDLVIPASSSITVQYVVQVNSNLEIGTVIESNNGSVNGVLTNNISNTVSYLNDSEYSQIETTLLSKVNASETSILNLANTVFSKEIFTDSIEIILEGLYPYPTETSYGLNTNSTYYEYVLPNFYNGLSMDIDATDFKNERVRLVKSTDLMAGDIIIACIPNDTTGTSFTYKAYMYVNKSTILEVSNNKVVKRTSKEGSANTKDTTNTSTTQFLEQLTGYNRWVILRPTIVENE